MGINGSQVSGDDLAGFDKAGLFGGLFVNRSFGSVWSGELGIVYSAKGSRKIAQPDKGDYVSYLLQLNYIEVPLTARYGFRQFQFELGPSFGVLISSTEENQIGQIVTNREFKDFELSLNAGVIYNVNEHFGVNFRINNSVIPIRPHASGATAAYRLNWGQYNTAINFSLRLSF